MQQSTLRLATTLGMFLCLVGIAPTPVVAQTDSAYTAVTVHKPVRLPGMVLSPGRYSFEFRLNGMPYVVIRGYDPPFATYVPVIRINRRNIGADLAIRSPVAGSVAELATWYPGGGTLGYEFVQQAASPNVLSARNLADLDKRLSVAEDGVSDAQSQLSITESSRNVILTERGDAR